MIRFISYIGPKDHKAINVSLGRTITFPKGKVVNIAEFMSQAKAKELLRSGLFKLHGSSAIVPLEEPVEELENQCHCGFVARSKAGLSAHRRKCEA